MRKARRNKPGTRTLGNQRRERASFLETLSWANRKAREEANRRSGKRELKSVRAAIAATGMEDDTGSVEWWKRLGRWMLGVALLPLCWVTMWTLLSRFSHATLEQGFLRSEEFWYFAIGGGVMAGWFVSGLLRAFFLYLYVLGHELTHVVFVKIFRGEVMDFHVSADGGYITTNKTNLVIALSPYFVPFWSVVLAALYGLAGCFTELRGGWDLAFYGVMGLTWTFHLIWTLWMLPRDQPDLKENGTFLSLVVIYLANLLVLVALLCVAEDAPLSNTREFAMEWLRHAATWGDAALRWAVQAIEELRVAAKL